MTVTSVLPWWLSPVFLCWWWPLTPIVVPVSFSSVPVQFDYSALLCISGVWTDTVVPDWTGMTPSPVWGWESADKQERSPSTARLFSLSHRLQLSIQTPVPWVSKCVCVLRHKYVRSVNCIVSSWSEHNTCLWQNQLYLSGVVNFKRGTHHEVGYCRWKNKWIAVHFNLKG